MSEQPTVFIVDDDAVVLDSMRWVVESVGLKVETFDSAQAMLERFEPGLRGCLVLDVRMPGISGLELHERLKAAGSNLATIVISGHGDVQMAVRALKSGVLDFIEKPFNDQELLDCIQDALARDARDHSQRQRNADLEAHYMLLTPRERDVLNHVVDGKSNREISAELNISPKTVEVHRSRVMEKMEAHSVSELVRMTLVIQNKGKPLSM